MTTPASDRNQRLLVKLVLLVVGMVALSYVSVPLYDLFCRVTGFGGTTQRATVAPTTISERTVKVFFVATVNNGLDWEFKPEQRSVTVKIGEVGTNKFLVRNNGSVAQVGTSTYNVQPDKAGAYFSKIQCFCFEEHMLKPGETAEFPVQFFVDPAMLENLQNEDVREITLSYSFFLAKDQSKAQQAK